MSRVIRIDGQPTPPAAGDIVETEQGIYSVLLNGRSYEVRLGVHGIVVNGHRFQFDVADPRKWQRSAGRGSAQGTASIVAPMPGKIVRVLVSAGDEVRSGQGILVMEAMKMQNELKAARAGRVLSISAEAGQTVAAGTVLAVLDNVPGD